MSKAVVTLVLLLTLTTLPALHCTATVLLSASPSVLERSLDLVTLTWKGVASPNVGDFITIYSPPDNPYEVGYVPVTQSSTWSTGGGSAVVPLVNARVDYAFEYISNTSTVNNTDLSPIARSNHVSFRNPNEPLQVHLQLTHDPTQMLVMWTTRDLLPSTVNYSTDAGNLATVRYATAKTYTIHDMCDAPANSSFDFRDPGYIYTALLDDLRPGTLYHYRVGSNTGGYSDEFYFLSSPGIGKDIPIEVILYGDLGVRVPFDIPQEQQYEAQGSARFITQQVDRFGTTHPSMILHVGDISYARGWAYLWEWFMAEIQPAASRVPYMVGTGNHDYDYTEMPYNPGWYGNDSGGECAVPYGTRFIMPGTAPNSNFWYSFEYGPVHFTVMSTEHDFSEGSTQWQFLKKDLESVNRDITPWIVFGGHRPMYTSSVIDESVGQALMQYIEPLFAHNKVNLAIWGHVHDYERTCGMYNFTCAENDNEATVHTVIGMAGNDAQAPWNQAGGSGHYVQPDWIVFRSMNYGYTTLFANSTHLNLKYFDNTRGEVHDSLWLQQRQ